VRWHRQKVIDAFGQNVAQIGQANPSHFRLYRMRRCSDENV